MKQRTRALCLLFALLLLVSLIPPRAGAASTVYFTAVNDQLLPLNDETMPFWSNGILYVPYTAFENSDFGINYSRSRDKTVAVLYRQQGVGLLCDFPSAMITDRGGKSIANGPPLSRGDVVFLPLDSVCRFFGLQYSYTRISYGYLVRIKNESVVLSDATFIDAASSSMAQRYTRYERSKLPQDEAPAAPEPSASAVNEPTEEQVRRTVYLVVESTESAQTEQLLSHLPSGHAAFLFTPAALSGSHALARRLAAEGDAIALHIDASSGDAADTLAQIEAGNRTLWAAANTKTRLVYLDGADEETTRAVSDAGYRPLRFSLRLSGSLPSASRLSTRIFSAADANRGSCAVLLGEDSDVARSLSALLIALRAGSCTPARLTETSPL